MEALPLRSLARGAVLVGLVAALVRGVFFIGVRYNDEFEYARQAHLLATGGFQPGSTVYSHRLGIVAPAALFERLVREPRLSACLWSEVCSVGMAVLAFLFASRLHSVRAGLWAGLIAAVYPLSVSNASHLYGDPAAAFFIALAAFLVWRRKAGLSFASAGWVLGVAHLCKESAFFALPLFLLYGWARKERRILWVVAGFSLVVIAEMGFYAATTGSPLARFSPASQGHHFQDIERVFEAPGTIPHRVFLDLPMMWFWPLDFQFPFFGLTFYAFAAAVGLLWKRRSLPGVRFFLTWWGICAFLTNFWPLRIWPYLPGFLLYARVLDALTVPTVVIIAVALAGAGRGVRIAAAAGLGVLPLALCFGIQLYYHEWTRGLRGTHEALLRDRPNVVYGDAYSNDYLRFWNGFRPPYELRTLTESPEPGSVVVVHSRYLQHTILRDRRPIPDSVSNPPSSWTPVYSEIRRDRLRAWRGRLLRIDPRLWGADYSITVYRVP